MRAPQAPAARVRGNDDVKTVLSGSEWCYYINADTTRLHYKPGGVLELGPFSKAVLQHQVGEELDSGK